MPEVRRTAAAGVATALFLVAFGVRVLFAFATPDATWPYSFAFQGDALVFLQHAQAIQSEQPFGFDLPLRAPATSYLVALLWGGAGFSALRWTFLVFGALLAPALYLSARCSLGERVAGFAGCFTAIATGPLLLSGSISAETPYLLLATPSVAVLPAIRRSSSLLPLAIWGAVQGIACLFRAEHVAWFVAGTLYAALGHGRFLARALLSAAWFAVVLAPWQVSVYRSITKLNGTGGAPPPRTTLPWTESARSAIEAIPVFARPMAIRFLEDTVRVRGRDRVNAEDLSILVEAYDSIPEPLAPFPFIASSGAMNFYLANHETGRGGFSNRPLFELPPLRGGPSAYPPGLTEALGQMSALQLDYPPHLAILEHGYALGWAKIRANPGAWAGLCVRKFRNAWAGAAHGLGGHALPLGLSGLRRPVDITVPSDDHPYAWIWQIAFGLVALYGAALALRHESARPWLLWILVRVLVVAVFFGYARHGALLTPALGVLFGLIYERPHLGLWKWTGLTVVAVVLTVDACRYVSPPEVTVDGVPVDGPDPFRESFDGRRIVVR